MKRIAILILLLHFPMAALAQTEAPSATAEVSDVPCPSCEESKVWSFSCATCAGTGERICPGCRPLDSYLQRRASINLNDEAFLAKANEIAITNKIMRERVGEVPPGFVPCVILCQDGKDYLGEKCPRCKGKSMLRCSLCSGK